LKEHTYIHTGQKPFRCPYEGCTKAFRQAGKLSMHKKLHQNKIFIVSKIKKSQNSVYNNEDSKTHNNDTSVNSTFDKNYNLSSSAEPDHNDIIQEAPLS
jgi:uncharacterized Zn-finger protein